MSDIKITNINPNFSVVTEAMPNLESASLGVFWSHGSRYEPIELNGITHLIEHMLFKGTKKINAKEISYCAEAAGALLDGFTTKETSGIYCRYFATAFDSIMDLIGEIISSPRFDTQDLEKEKNVITQEIVESLEDPHEHVFNILFEGLFPGHPLSFLITGKVNTVQTITRENLVEYYYNKFLPSKVCISAAGKINHDELVKKLTIEKHQLLAMRSSPPPITTPSQELKPLRLFQNRSDLNQLHSAGASLTFSFTDERRCGLNVLNNILGGSMSSRFFQRLREKEGLVYTISSFVDFFSDIGLFGYYYVADIKNAEKIFRSAIEESNKLKKYGVTKEEFERTIKFYKGMLAIGTEDPMSRMMRNAKNQLLLDKIVSIDDSMATYDRLTLGDVNNLSSEIKPPHEYSVAHIGPISEKDYINMGFDRSKTVVLNNYEKTAYSSE